MIWEQFDGKFRNMTLLLVLVFFDGWIELEFYYQISISFIFPMFSVLPGLLLLCIIMAILMSISLVGRFTGQISMNG